MLPKSVPDNPASTPSSAYTSARPIAYASVSANGRHRDCAPALSPPTSATVIGIIGYTQGVRLVSTPAANRSGSARSGCERSGDNYTGSRIEADRSRRTSC